MVSVCENNIIGWGAGPGVTFTLLSYWHTNLPTEEMDWKLVILEKLRLRNQKESGGFTELILSRKNCIKPL